MKVQHSFIVLLNIYFWWISFYLVPRAFYLCLKMRTTRQSIFVSSSTLSKRDKRPWERSWISLLGFFYLKHNVISLNNMVYKSKLHGWDFCKLHMVLFKYFALYYLFNLHHANYVIDNNQNCPTFTWWLNRYMTRVISINNIVLSLVITWLLFWWKT